MSAPRAERALPGLDAIVRDPASVASLTPADIAKLLAEVGAAQAILTAQLLAAPVASVKAEADEWLTAAEGAAMLRRQRSWLYRNCRRLPFVKRTGSRSPLLCSKQGIQRYLARL